MQDIGCFAPFFLSGPGRFFVFLRWFLTFSRRFGTFI
jgi:hypothetical protein